MTRACFGCVLLVAALGADVGGAGEDFVGALFGDGWGFFAPQQDLNVLASTSLENLWSLRVIDTASGRVGTLEDLMLRLCVSFVG